jgi:hypothetical protein
MTTKTKTTPCQILLGGFEFTYFPNLRCMEVRSPNGNLEICHNLYGEKWIAVSHDIVDRHVAGSPNAAHEHNYTEYVKGN